MGPPPHPNQRRPHGVFRGKGVGKSELAQTIYIILSLPWPDNPLGWQPPNRPVKTLYLDYELPGYIAQGRVQEIVRGHNLPEVILHHRRCKIPLAHDIEAVYNHVHNLKAEVVIIDSLARAAGGPLNETEPANAFSEALDKLETTSLILGQTSKNPDTKRKSIYGSTLFTYYARSIWELCKAEENPPDYLNCALFHRDANLTRRFPEVGIQIHFNGTSTTVERQSVSLSDFIEKISVQKAITQELRHGKLLLRDLKDRLGVNENTLKSALTRMRTKGLVANDSAGAWFLPAR